MFKLTRHEYEVLRCQPGTSKNKSDPRGGTRYMLFVFTQESVSMLSGVLTSDRAVQVNIAIIRAFVKMHEMLETYKELAKKLDQLERKFLQHDEQFKTVFEAIRRLMSVGSPIGQKRIKGLGVA